MTQNDKIKNFSISKYGAFGGSLGAKDTEQVSQTATIQRNNRNYFITQDRSILSYMYMNYGLIQVLIDQPVDDAFRGGIIIKSDELTDDDLNKINTYMTQNEVLKQVKKLAKWNRLFGGGGMVINTEGKANDKININSIKKSSRLEFYPADLWELSIRNPAMYGDKKPYEGPSSRDGESFFFYGNELDSTRVIKVINKEAPSLLRPQLRGWGMSEVERCVRELNAYLKNSALVFELLDEAKVDVMKINGFSDSMSFESSDTSMMTARIQTALKIKNFQSALIMDKEDEFEQKQLSFAGLADMSVENRIGIASCLRMPVTKVFGISPGGFSTGEDEIENYNAMIESEIRGEFDKVIIEIVKLICKKELDFIPSNIEISYRPLRILKSTEEEEVKDRQMKRLLDLYDRGLIVSKQLEEQLNIANITPNKIELSDEDYPVPPFQQPSLSYNEDDIKKDENIKNSKKFFKWSKN